MDVVTAFLHAEVETNIYMKHHKGQSLLGLDGSRLVSKLKNALYGIREASKTWNALLTAWLVSYEVA